MRRIIVTIFAILMVVSLFTACGGQKTADTIKIGINMELSGAVATYGQDSVKGIELAIKQINEAGGIDGKKVDVIKYDNKSDAAEATTLATKLMTSDKVLAIMGPATSGAFKAEIPVAIQNKVPVISGSATADDVTFDASGVKEYAFRICFNDSYQGTAMANFALKNLSKTKAVILMDSSNDYSKGLAESFTAAFTEGGGTIVSQEAYVAGDTDFNAVLTKMKDMDFDVLFVPGYYEEAGLIVKQARALGITVPVLGADGFDSPKLAELAGADAANDIYFSNHYSSLDESPIVQDFIKEFKDEYGVEPNAFNALGYDLGKFTCDGISRASQLTGEAVKDALKATKDFEGVTGTFSVGEDHNAIKALVVIEMQGGKQVSSVRAGV
ncbi:MAG: ABC transporter substrate-binding protein [Christensenellales bacterium]|jgi:branched-chain amino acid transport system substrate-binding protein